jgi:hypothetical protein
MILHTFILVKLFFAITTPLQRLVMVIMYILCEINRQIQPFWIEVSGYINWVFPNMPEMNADFVFILQTFALGLTAFMYLMYLEDEVPKHMKRINDGM